MKLSFSTRGWQRLSWDELLASAEIGDPPPDGAAAFADLLLEANLDSDAVFAKSKESGRYVLTRRIALAGLDGEAFDVSLESFVNRAEAWRRLLADYRPDLLEEVKKLVHEGRWEVTAPTWVEHDKNMPSGESQVRQLLYAKR